MTCLNLQNDPLQTEQADPVQILQQQKIDAIGSLACGISHEFNNLLQTIHGYTKFALESLEVDSQAHKDLQHVLGAADRAMVLTQQLLDFSRVEEVNPQCSSIDQVVQDLAEMLQPLLPKDIELQIHLDAHSTWALIDAHHVHQALLNLCLNARDAMPEGGVILIESSTGTLTESCLVTKPGLHTSSKYVCITVTDTGTGIPEEVQKHVFEPFYTTKEVGKGTGLGLAVTFGVIQQAGGHIELFSTLDQGTTFEIYLPTCLENTLERSSPTCPKAEEISENN
ncbi:MAG: hypothetical protein GXP24_04695 [Planctomycetes bacterium]|nr:hypothetical protein [Planctomycetota bacterium]